MTYNVDVGYTSDTFALHVGYMCCTHWSCILDIFVIHVVYTCVTRWTHMEYNLDIRVVHVGHACYIRDI